MVKDITNMDSPEETTTHTPSTWTKNYVVPPGTYKYELEINHTVPVGRKQYFTITAVLEEIVEE